MYSEHPDFSPATPENEQRVEEILARLTLEEKIFLLGGVVNSPDGNTRGIPEKGVPALKMADGPVGVHWWTKASTCYPACIALAASWDRELGYAMGRGLGRDARARGVHILLAPGVNIYRSPLCGRNFEYLGEDPCLSAEMVTGYIRGCQDQGVATTVKHYALNFQEYDRHGISSDVDERTLREVYLPAFEAAVKAGGTGCLMTGYNLVNGEHCSEHQYLVNDILKGEWGFDGLVMSDWVSTYNAVAAANHGLDLEMPTPRFLNAEKLLPAIANGLVTEATIDDKIRRLLRLAVCFGWLDRDQQDTTIPDTDPETGAVALEVARRGSVLLKNDGLLPLDAGGLRRLAMIGSHAAKPVIGGGGSSYTPPNHLTAILDEVKRLAGADVAVEYAAGVDPWRHEARFADSAFFTPDGQRGLRGEYWKRRDADGEPDLVRVDTQLDFDWNGPVPADGFSNDNYRIRWTGELRADTSGAHYVYLGVNEAVYRLEIGGKVLIDSNAASSGSVKRATIDLQAGERYSIHLEYRALRPWNAMHLGYEPVANVEEDMAAAISLAESADAVILCTGFTKETEGEGFDRTFALPAEQQQLIERVAAVNPRTAVVLHAGGNVAMDWLDGVQALLHAWYPGQEGGRAIAEILFGVVNPSGKLPATFERRIEDRSSVDCYHDRDGDRRVQMSDGIFGGYRHHDRHGIAPRFPFGFGLSYTTFAYDNLALSSAAIQPGDSLELTFDLVNTGDRAGAEVAQVYVRDEEASLLRPVKELKGFARVELQPGERRQVQVSLPERAFQFYDPARGWVAEPGAFEVLVGASSDDIRLSATFTLSE